MGDDTDEVGFDETVYKVRTPRCEITYVIGAEQTPATVDNVDVFVTLPDDSRWCATVFSYAEVGRLMDEFRTTGECLDGRYFAVWDQLIVRDPGVDSITAVIEHLLDDGELTHIFRPLEPEDQED